ncbi:MAG: hypothetical protein V2B14_01490 [bacterium]
MKKFASSIILASCLTMFFINSVNAADRANTTISGHLPVYSRVTATADIVNVDISAESGQLEGSVAPTFHSFTNNKNGVNVQFTVAATASTGDVNGSIGTTANSNIGKIVLANTDNDSKPTAAGITDALSEAASVANNANVIAYQVQFTGSRNDSNPKFTAAGDTVANIIAPVGVTTFTVQLTNNSGWLTDTYSYESDLSGYYQATITCTVANL